ncbi:hypothetical protein FA13DRAFT_401 [Coprinellus micaceus]|uniref:Uncharacterized protein n=1 Tax=Coprinellus micaceus TaxID=71717 RepID=A0A4Y7U0S7_COPMI|nr:hypothetical protein FA13DRAFT_401 [Coprinellus micaceus]
MNQAFSPILLIHARPRHQAWLFASVRNRSRGTLRDIGADTRRVPHCQPEEGWRIILPSSKKQSQGWRRPMAGHLPTWRIESSPPPNIAPRHQTTPHYPLRPSPVGGPAQNSRNQHPESQRLLPPTSRQGFVPRGVELRTQPSRPSVASFASRDAVRDQGPKVPGPYRQSPQYRLYQQQGNTPLVA